MTFQELMALLPACDGPNRFPLRRIGEDLRYPLNGLEAFVAPDLAARPDVEANEHPSVIIISAAGAVGKTTLARQLAFEKNALLWDLADSRPVGQSSFSGTLLSVFGADQIAEIDLALRSGSLFVVIDALDEGRVKTKQDGFDAFLQDLAVYAKAGPGVKFVVLGRTHIADETWLSLEYAGVSAVLYTLETFTRQQAEEYIWRRISTEWPQAFQTIKSHEQPFVEARDLVLDHLRKVIRATDEENTHTVENFLGYAPVLDAVATLLAGESNYAELTSRLGDEIAQLSDQHQGPIILLCRIVGTILEREQKHKILTNLKRLLEAPAKRAGWNGWDTLYNPEQQCQLLLAHVLGKPLRVEPTLPPELRDKFEEHLKTWLPEHPFLRDGRRPANTVFQSYLLAQSLSTPSLGLQADAEAFMNEVSYKPSRLVADFYLLFAHENDDDTVVAHHIGLLYESLMSAETEAEKMRLALEGSDPDDDYVEEETEGEFELMYMRGGQTSEVVATRMFKTLIRPDTRVTFSRQLREASIVIPCTLVLGNNTGEFTIGPNVDSKCREIEINATTLIVSSNPESANPGADTDVVLEAGKYSGSVLKRPVARGTLQVSWPGAEVYPWTEFHGELQKDFNENGQLRYSYRRFRRIVMTLQSHSKGQLARYRAKIEHSRILQGALGEALLHKLVRDGILKIEGHLYVWVPDTADKVVGISWHDLRLGKSSETLNAYLQNFLSTI